jgi:hypothetical protein
MIDSTGLVKRELRDFIDVAKDWKKLMIVLCNITTVLPVTAFTKSMPLVVQGMGYSGITAILMSVLPAPEDERGDQKRTFMHGT